MANRWPNVGDTVRIKLRSITNFLLLGIAGASLGLSGCGGGSTPTNVVVVRVSPTGGTLVVNQSFTATALVTGATDTSVTWTCTFTTQVTSGTTTTTSPPKPCDATTGQLSNPQATTVTFTAPPTVPNPPPTITITATSNADKTKSATSVINLDSGIRVTVVPATATVATGSKFQFTASLTTDPKPNNVTWLVTQATTISPTAAKCDPACGSIDSNGLYTAPATVPTIATVTIVAVSILDTTRFGTAIVTVVLAGPISFQGVSPTSAPLGGLFQDVFLAATSLTSNGQTITVDSPAGTLPIDPAQIKVLFGPTSSASSIGARVRLNAEQISRAGLLTFKISSTNPASPVTQVPGGNFSVNVVPVKPSVIASDPASLPQDSQSLLPNGPSMTIDGGYYGPPNHPVASAAFNNATLPIDPSKSTPRQLNVTLPPLNALSGLYPVSVTSGSASPSTSYTNIAVIPDYLATNKPDAAATLLSLPVDSAPSAIALDTVLGVAVLAEAGASKIQFLDVTGTTPALLGPQIQVGTVPSSSAPGGVPTGVAVDEMLHIAAIANYADRSLWVFQIPAPGQAPSTTPLAQIDLSTLIPTAPGTTPPFPYSVGIDPFTHRALVAFASTNVGFVVNLDPTLPISICLPGHAPAAPPAYCVVSSVSLNTGASPQIAFEPRIHLAYVTPGGAGNMSVVDLTRPATQVEITTISRTSNVVTVTTSKTHGLNPGNPGTVLISGVTTGKTNFNGSFAVTSVIDSTRFTYSQTAADDTATGTPGVSLITYGNPFLTFSLTPTTQGIAINPETRTAVLADPNAPSSQIEFISSLDQAVSSLTLYAGATGVVTSGPPEIGATNVAYQPFTNTAVSFNPQTNQVSLLDPVRFERLAIVPTSGTGVKNLTFSSGGASATLKLAGALAVDPVKNLALAVNSGSNNISVFKLSQFIKPVHIEQVVTPPLPGAVLPQAAFTSTTALSGVKIFGSGFDAGSQVRLDGTLVGVGTVISNREIDINIPAQFLAVPRRFGLDVVNSGGVASNVTDFTVVQSVAIPACSGTASAPGAVAIDEQRDIALVTNAGCADVAVISLKPSNLGTVTTRLPAAGTPTAVAVMPRFGLAVVTNNAAGSASILNLDTNTKAAENVTVGSAPNGVAINQETGIAVIANTGSNTVTTIDLTPLTATPKGTLTPLTVAVDQTPIAVAIDPDRGTNNRGVAVVTALVLTCGTGAFGALDVVDIGAATPIKSNASCITGVLATPTGIVFDPAGPGRPFYVTSSQANLISAFNADSGASQAIKVGINPTSLAINSQTGTILTVNALSNTISLIDAQTFRTKATLGIGGSSQYAAAIHTIKNLAVIADQANNRVLLFPLP